MCAEGLSALLNNYTGGFFYRVFWVCNRARWITYLLFADDSLIFIDASTQGAARLNTILQMYNEASGQMVNREKSYIFFSSSILEENRDLVKQELDIMVEAFSEKYLGLPTAVGNLTNEDFEYISGRIRSKITGWDKLMSYAGKDVMIKAVLQAIPNFSMSCFQLSKGTCQKIISLIARFWWSGSIDKKAMHWLSWDKLEKPKCCGGMGF
jgi:hypothetical protein